MLSSCITYVLLLSIALNNNQNDYNIAKELVTILLEKENVNQTLKAEILANVEKNFGKERLVGKSEDNYYSLVFRKVTSDNIILINSSINDVKNVSISDCLRYFTLEQVFFKNQLNKGNFAREALTKAFKESIVSGKIKYEINAAKKSGNIFCGITIAKKANMESALKVSGDEEKFKICYRYLIHKESDKLLKSKSLDIAFDYLDHLVKTNLANHNTWLGIGKFYIEKSKKEDAYKALEQAFKKSVSTKTQSHWYYDLGILAVSIDGIGGNIALLSFKKAIELFEKENNSFDLIHFEK